MKHGHVTGTRRTRPGSTSWYAAIEQATLAVLDATWHADNPTPQEVTSDNTQAIGTMQQRQASAAGISPREGAGI